MSKVRIPTEDRINKLLVQDLKKLAGKLNISFKAGTRASTLRKKILEIKYAKSSKSTKKNKKTQRNTIRNKRKKPGSGSGSNDENETNSVITSKKKKAKTKPTSKAAAAEPDNNANTEVNKTGPPNVAFWPKVDFQRKDKHSIDINATFIKQFGKLVIDYRNKRHVVVVSNISITGAYPLNGDIILGQIDVIWNDPCCVNEDNPRGTCFAVFDVMDDHTLKGFEYISFLSNSAEELAYKQYINNTNSKRGTDNMTINNQQETPMDPSQIKAISNGLELIDALFENKTMTTDDLIQLNKHKNGLNKMISREKFNKTQYEYISNELLNYRKKGKLNKMVCHQNINTFNNTLNASNTNNIPPSICDTTTNSVIPPLPTIASIPTLPTTLPTLAPTSSTKSTKKTSKNCVCKFCLKAFSNNTDLNHHTMSYHQNEEKVLKCDRCNKAFQTQLLLKQHTKKKHFQRQKIGQKCAVIRDGVKCMGDLQKATVWNDSRLWRNWGLEKVHPGKEYCFCLRCSKCGIIWKWVENYNYTENGNPTGRTKKCKK